MNKNKKKSSISAKKKSEKETEKSNISSLKGTSTSKGTSSNKSEVTVIEKLSAIALDEVNDEKQQNEKTKSDESLAEELKLNKGISEMPSNELKKYYQIIPYTSLSELHPVQISKPSCSKPVKQIGWNANTVHSISMDTSNKSGSDSKTSKLTNPTDDKINKKSIKKLESSALKSSSVLNPSTPITSTLNPVTVKHNTSLGDKLHGFSYQIPSREMRKYDEKITLPTIVTMKDEKHKRSTPPENLGNIGSASPIPIPEYSVDSLFTNPRFDFQYAITSPSVKFSISTGSGVDSEKCIRVSDLTDQEERISQEPSTSVPSEALRTENPSIKTPRQRQPSKIPVPMRKGKFITLNSLVQNSNAWRRNSYDPVSRNQRTSEDTNKSFETDSLKKK